MGIRGRIRAGEAVLKNAGVHYAMPWLRRLAWIRFALTWAGVIAVLALVAVAVSPI
ncbi:hypothetical protein [Lentzea sp. NBRC 102530]|uniref:hypothetical protein n=1 Tax=Lentzea sp. NBRC 102530 TaxID=3032201 RepID=UPI0024A53341|nr:hypothetical protein [Lentzea sp. NBRC 102530]GLY54874.1 hypothetical protein Lesp01_85290 [Lentzea sp. NBRC 102530]